MVRLLTRFPQYTLATLRTESADLLRYLNIVDYARKVVADLGE